MKIFILVLVFLVFAKEKVCPVQKFAVLPSRDETLPIVNQCTIGSIEKVLFENLNIYQVDPHHQVFDIWYENLDRSKKYTLIHVDSRLFYFYLL